MLTPQRLEEIVNSLMNNCGQVTDEWISRQCAEHRIDEETLTEMVMEALDKRGKMSINERYIQRKW